MGENYRVIKNPVMMNQIENIINDSIYKSLQDMRIDIDQAQTVPFRTGMLDNSAFVKETADGKFQIGYSAPYALEQYYIPMPHYTGQHANATDHWMDPYIPFKGTKGDFLVVHVMLHSQPDLERVLKS